MTDVLFHLAFEFGAAVSGHFAGSFFDGAFNLLRGALDAVVVHSSLLVWLVVLSAESAVVCTELNGSGQPQCTVEASAKTDGSGLVPLVFFHAFSSGTG